MSEAYIVAAARTAGGRRNGRLKDWHPADLGGLVIDGVLDKLGIDPRLVDDVVFGCVQQVGQQSQNVARTVALSSRLPESVPGVTIDRQCGSSQQAVHFAAQAVMSGAMDVVIAGGVESMTRVPMFIASTLPEKNGMGHYRGRRFQSRYGDAEPSQFNGAEMLAVKYDLPKDCSTSSHSIVIARQLQQRTFSRRRSCRSRSKRPTVETRAMWLTRG
jgi:acetyl-CoA C-acetyltransferase